MENPNAAPEPRVNLTQRIVYGVLIVFTIAWTLLFWNDLPGMWAPYGLGLGFLVYVAWLFRPRSGKSNS